MNSFARTAAYVRQNGTDRLTPKQLRRATKKHRSGRADHFAVESVFDSGPAYGVVTAAATIDTEQFDKDRAAIRSVAPKRIKAKVGIITYEGFVSDADHAFHYTTRAGVQKHAAKFTILDD